MYPKLVQMIESTDKDMESYNTVFHMSKKVRDTEDFLKQSK